MGKVTPQEAHEAAIKLNLKKRRPYELISKHSFKLTKHKEWMIVLCADDVEKPIVAIDGIKSAKKARRMKALLERAWAEGFYAAGMS